MGWCSATDIMDAALKAAEDTVAYVLVNPEDFWYGAKNLGERREDLQVQADNVLRPFVTRLAKELRDGDWDCIDESDYFQRFPQEMLGHDDTEHRDWLIRKIRQAEDPDEIVDLANRLMAHVKKMKGTD